MRRRNGIAFLGGAMLVCGALPAAAETRSTDHTRPDIDSARISADIRSLRTNGLSDMAIQYVFRLDGLDVPITVIAGRRSAQDAVDDGSIRRQSVPSSPLPPPMTPTPEPNLKPKGSSASDWQPPGVTVPSIDTMRRSVMSTTKPPRC